MVNMSDLLNNLDSVEQDNQKQEEFFKMLDEMISSYGHLVMEVQSIGQKLHELAGLASWTKEHVEYLLAKDEEYMAAVKSFLENQNKEGNGEADALSTDMSEKA
jgi:argonaute-like protein implicated in RNA metabolism and viral defense